MSMKVSAPDGVKVYNISSGKTLPQWLSEGKKKSLKKNEEFRRRLELLQDFRFPAACQRLKITPDGQYVFATGYHPPQVKVYDLSQLSLKFDRHLDAEIVDFQILTEDYSKAVFLCADRTLCFHARFGAYHKTRVPRFGRDLAYVPHSAELAVVGSAPEVWRLSLEEGRFMTPWATRAPAINAAGISSVHGLLACAGEDGGLECFDTRARAAVGCLDAAAQCKAAGQELTTVRFDDNGLHVAVGTRGGLVGLFDLRSQRPLLVKDHMYGSPILDIKFHSSPGDAGGSTRRVISSDRHIIKIWDARTGQGYTSIEPTQGDVNDVCVWPNSGLLMVGCDTSVVQGYFIPSLGPAPRWCAHLEGLTEELEEQAPAVYDDYRFVTKADLSKLGLDHLVGTPLLRAYMHGFFLDNRLYNKAAALTQPLAYEAYRQQRVSAKLEAERASRISVVKRLPKVNAAVAARLLSRADAGAAAATGDEGNAASLGKKGAAVSTLLEDERFKAMFEDEDFEVDPEAAEYKALHPNAKAGERRGKAALLEEHFEQVDSDEEEHPDLDAAGSSDAGSSDVDSDDDDDALFQKGRGRARGSSDRQRVKQPASTKSSVPGVARGGVQKPPDRRMYAAREAGALEAFAKGESRGSTLHQPLAERVAKQEASGRALPTRRVGGSREFSFVPRDGAKGGGRSGGGRGRPAGQRGGRGRGRGGGRGRH